MTCDLFDPAGEFAHRLIRIQMAIDLDENLVHQVLGFGREIPIGDAEDSFLIASP